jgi:lauroyl/myristoyl acyltransferase
LFLARVLPPRIVAAVAGAFATIYWLMAGHRREVVIENVSPVFNGDNRGARRAARKLFRQFALKLADLWRYEGGVDLDPDRTHWMGWENFATAQARARGVLLVTPHLGNWEFGAAYFVQHNIPLLVLTQAEPEAKLTQLRQASRARRGIETLVVGEDAFAFMEIIKRLQAGATVALLVDRPTPATEVTVNLFGKPFPASIAAAELARASGCVLLPVFIPREGNTYGAYVLPPIEYVRAALRDREARVRLTQEIFRAFEEPIRQHLNEWYHFIPIWKRS